MRGALPLAAQPASSAPPAHLQRLAQQALGAVCQREGGQLALGDGLAQDVHHQAAIDARHPARAAGAAGGCV